MLKGVNSLIFKLIVLSFLYTSAFFGQKNHKAYLYIDSGKDLSFDLVKSKSFNTLEDNFVHHNWTSHTYWVKIKPNTQFKNNECLVLANSFNHYEQVFFVTHTDSVYTKSIGANQLYQSATYIPSFILNNNIKEIYLSIKSDAFLFESFKIRDNAKVVKEISFYLIFEILFITYVVSLLIYMIILFRKLKSQVVKNYIYYLLGTISMIFFISNLGRFLIWDVLPFSASYMECTFSFFMVATYLFFALEIMKAKAHMPLVYNIARGYVFILGLTLLLSAVFLPPRYLSLFSGIYPSIGLILVIVIAFKSFRSLKNHTRLYIVGVFFFIAGTSSRILINKGVLPYTFAVEAIVYFGLLVELIIFTIIVIREIDERMKLAVSQKEYILHSNEQIDKLKNDIEQIKTRQKSEEITLSDKINQTLVDPLTKRELEVLKELMTGKNQLEIANKLFISKSTLKTHISNVYSKLGVRARIEAVNRVRELMN